MTQVLLLIPLYDKLHITKSNSLEGFNHPFERDLLADNKWVKLASLVPWDYPVAIYSSKLQSDTGRKSVDIRTVIAALIVKHKLRLDDRGTIEMIQENIYIQYSMTNYPITNYRLCVRLALYMLLRNLFVVMISTTINQYFFVKNLINKSMFSVNST
jgi:hypothetical protein